MYFAGIDPGLSGALGIVDADGAFVLVADAPVSAIPIARSRRIQDGLGGTKTRQVQGIKRVFIPTAMLDALPRDLRLIAIEEVGTRPGESPIAAYSFGFGRGLWVMAATVLRIPLIEPRPQVWKKMFGLPADKEAVRLLALKRWPEAATMLCRKRDEGRAEALYLAEYARHHTTPGA